MAGSLLKKIFLLPSLFFILISYICKVLKLIAMNIETIREYALSLPYVTEDFPFDEENLVFRLQGKIFACINLTNPDSVTLKCNPEYALELREAHPEIAGAWHWNKKYWNQNDLTGGLTDALLRGLVRHSYSEVVKKLTRKERMAYPEMLDVKE